MKVTDKKIGKLKKFFGRQNYVSFAYLFGSAAKGRQGPLSDIDIAVFLERNLGKSARLGKKLFLINEISSILGTDRLDLVVMNDASLLLNYNIIKNSQILKTSKQRVLFEARLISEYLDRRFYDEMYTRLSLKRIEKKGIL